MFAAEKVGFINVDGAIGPATASYISRSIEEAKAQNVQCLVIQLNTPGGLLDSTQKIVQSFLGSPVPVVVYVAPTGARGNDARNQISTIIEKIVVPARCRNIFARV